MLIRLTYAFLTVTVLFQPGVGRGQEQPVTSLYQKLPRLTFPEPANGGILTLVGGTYLVTPASVSIETEPGELGSTVSLRLWSASTENPYFVQSTGGVLFDGESLLHPAFGGTGFLYFAGTENGLGIPSPPLFLSGEYDGKTLRLSWQNPERGYDSIAVSEMGICIGRLDGAAEAAEISADTFLTEEMSGGRPHVCVVGYRDGVPSNAGVVRLSRGKQDDGPNTPFTANTKPNWRAWSFGGNDDGLILREESEALDVLSITDESGNQMPIPNLNFFQSMQIGNPEVQGGIYRKFLGLTPGRTYRVQGKLSTFHMEEATEEWSYSFHACPGYPDGRDFAPEQFAGKEPLPDGTEGPEAAQIVEYGSGHTTDGRWVTVSTGRSDSPWIRATGTSDLTLPEGVTEIVLWVRHTGADTPGVGFDWSSLEDLSVTGGGM